ncbi:MAG: TIGR03067 domain-containing protein [Acidobacteriota bacterium]
MEQTRDELQDFAAFLRVREQAARAYVEGNPSPLSDLAARELPATFFGPGGGYQEGADVLATYTRDAGLFEPGSETHFEILHMAADGGVGYWVGFQHASAKMSGNAEPIPMKLRVTEVFRREAGEWKLVHRHADMLAAPAKDRDSLDGTWLPVTAELSGRTFPDEVRKAIQLVIEGGRYTVTTGNQVDQGTVKTNPSATPKEIDITGTSGPNQGRTIPAIYDWDGDRLRVCYDLSGESRPTEFKTAEGTLLFLVTYERKKSQ